MSELKTRLKTKEPQYNVLLEIDRSEGRQRLGLMTNQGWRDDPKRLGFTLARYKFVAKMFAGLRCVLEVGCADAFGTRIVRQEVPEVTACDFDPVFIENNRRETHPKWPIRFLEHDMLKGPLKNERNRPFDGAFALDVIEHIAPKKADRFISNLGKSVTRHGVVLLGAPSLESQVHASAQSKIGHVNCMSGTAFKAVVARHFHNTFLFSMNDEVVHTGFSPMAQYLIVLACAPK